MLLTAQSAHGYTANPVYLVSATEVAWLCSNTVLLRDVETGQQRLLRGAGRGISCLAVNRQAGLLAYAEKGFQSRIHVHAIDDLRLLCTIAGDQHIVYTALGFSSDGKKLAACADDPGCHLTVWAWEQGMKLAQQALPAPATQVTFCPESAHTMCTTGGGQAMIWTLQRLWTKIDMQGQALEGVQATCHAWHAQGLCLGGGNGQLLVLDTSHLPPAHHPSSPPPPVHHTISGLSSIESISSHGAYLLIIGASCSVSLAFMAQDSGSPPELLSQWEIGTGAAVLAGDMAAGPQAHLLTAIVGTGDASLHLLDVDVSLSVPSMASTVLEQYHNGAVTGAVTHPDGCRVATCGKDGTVRVWAPTEEGRADMEAVRGFSSPQTCLASCSGRALLAVGSEAGVVRVLGVDASTSLPVRCRHRLHSAAVVGLAFSPSGAVLVSTARDNTIAFLHLPSNGSAPAILGWYQSPDTLMGVCWPKLPAGADETILVNLAAGGIMAMVPPSPSTPAAAADLQLSAREVQARAMRLETMFLHITADVVDGAAVVYGIGADKCVHKVVLPSDAAAWAGLRGRAHRSSARGQGHQKPAGHLALSPDGSALVTASADGSLAVWSKNLAAVVEAGGGAGVEFDTLAGGATAVAVGGYGRMVVSGGANGNVFCHSLEGAHVVSPPEVAPAALGGPEAADVDAEDLPDEPLRGGGGGLSAAVGVVQEAAAEGDTEEMHKAEQRLKQIARIVAKLVADNQNAPPMEQLERHELIVDVALMEKLKAEGDVHLRCVRDSILAENARQDIAAARIKAMCWDAMKTRGAFVSGMKNGMIVHNFAQLPTDNAAFKKAKMLRLVELQELAFLGVGHGGPGILSGRSMGSQTLGMPEEGDDAAAPDTPHAAGPDAVGVESLLYREVQLTTVTRRAMQVQFLRKRVQDITDAYNASFDRVVKQKVADTDKIAELNGKIDDTLRELQKLGIPVPADDKFWPTLAPYENAEDLFKVSPEEIKAEKYVSPADRKRLQEEEQAAEDRARRVQMDNAFDRALKQMMGGSLQGKSQQSDEFVLTKPEWMNGNPKDFSEDQKKEAREFVAKERQVAEEKAKKRAMLETELKGIRAAVDDAVAKFDDAVAHLYQQWQQAQAGICTTEMAIIHLCIGIEGAIAYGHGEEKKLQSTVAALKDKYAVASKAATEIRAQVEQQQEAVNACSTEDRQLDRTLKKDFGELDCYNRLLQLYKQRQPAPAQPASREDPHLLLPGQQAWQALASASSSADVLDGLDASLRPEGLDAAWWERFLEFRARKVQSEARLRDESTKLALMRQELEASEAEDERLGSAVAGVMAQYTDFRNKRKQLMYDVDMQLHLKLGQVEAEPPTWVSSDMSHATLLNRALVEGVNASIKEKGTNKVSVLTAIKDFKKGIYLAEWENQKADMVVEDLVEKARELQLLRVTKELQQLLKQGEQKVSTQDISNIENLIKTREALHVKKLEELRRKLRRVQDNIEAKKFQNMEASSHLLQVKQVLDDQSRLQMSLKSSDMQSSRKMKSLVTNKKLKDIAKAQADELALLTGELDKLQLRTFPSFFDTATRYQPPDTHIQ